MKKEKITIHEIAKSLGIDSSTVSRALNNSSRVNQKTKEKVLQKAKELGYQRNLLASNLRKNKSNTIGIIIPRISRHFFSTTIEGIEQTAYNAGYNVIICQSIESLDREKRIAQNLIFNRVDGVLISVSMETIDGSHLMDFEKNGIPLVFFDRHCTAITSSSKVLIDDEQGACNAVEHLISLGCKNIACFTGPQEVEIYKGRLKGYKKALIKNGLTYDEDKVIISRLMETDGKIMMQQLLEKHPNIDGLFANNDVSAIGAMKYLKEIGKKVPEDVAVIGFSNEPISEVIEPSLTTIDQSAREMGEIACTLLIKNIQEQDKLVNKTVILNPSLILRDSTNPRYTLR